MRREQIVFAVLRTVATRHWLQRPLNAALAPFNPFDHRRWTDPYPLYEAARAAGPVFFNRAAQTWIATGYDEVAELLRGPGSVERRRTVETLGPYRRLDAHNRDLLLSSMIMRDDPDHSRLRRLVNRAFTPRAIAALEPRVQQLTDELIGELAARPAGQPTDAMEGFADRLPIYTIGELLGLPSDRRERLRELSTVVAQFVDPVTGFDPAVMDATIEELAEIFGDLADERAARPGDDLMSALVGAEDDGDRLTRDELISMAILLLVAGHGSTANMLGNALTALGRHPAASARLRDEPALAANAVEELVRYDSPLQATDRILTEEVAFDDVTVPAGSVVLILIGAANRDPRRYDRPDELQLDRPDPRPISFGHGIHHCLGAALARLQARVALPAFVAAFPEVRVAEADLRWTRSMTFRGPETLPLVLEPARRPLAALAS